MSYTVRPVEMPDFNATLDRAQQARGNALAMQMQQREMQQSETFDNALRQYGPALMGQDAGARSNALTALGGMGGRGLAAAAPYHQQDQQRFRAMTPAELAASGIRTGNGSAPRINGLGQYQIDQPSDIKSPEAEAQALRLAIAGRQPRQGPVTWVDVKDADGNVTGQRGSNGQLNPVAAAPNMFGGGASGMALQYMTRAADAYGSGALQGQDAQRFEAAVALYQQPRTQFDPATGQTVTITPPIPNFIAGAIARRGGQQPGAQPAPVALPGMAGQPPAAPEQPPQAAATAPQGVPIGSTGMTASPPPSGVSIRSVAPPALGHPNEDERNASAYANRMQEAEQRMGLAEARGHQPGNLRDRIASSTGLVGNVVMSAQGQVYSQAQADWVRAKLRRESGAVIGAEEMAKEITTYFPQTGDSQEVRATKADARRIATEGMVRSSGRAGVPPLSTAAPTEAASNPFNLRRSP